MATHTMTPARRAALRKAQLASAAKRRRGGVGSAVKRSARQKAGAARANVQLARSGGSKKGVKKALKYTAIGVGAVAAGAGAVAYSRSDYHYVSKKTRKGVRNITSGKFGRGGRVKYAAAMAVKGKAGRKEVRQGIKKYKKAVRPLHKANAKRRKRGRR